MTPNDLGPERKPSRIQQRNRALILDAALDVFSQYGFRGATLDQLAAQSGLSKPNILYYFSGKEEIHNTLISSLINIWVDPITEIDRDGDPLEEILRYVDRKLEMSRQFPRESRLFAIEILQGAPRVGDQMARELKPLVDRVAGIIRDWCEAGRIAKVDPHHLLYSIWATTQHYADYEAQVDILTPGEKASDTARQYLDMLFRRLLTP